MPNQAASWREARTKEEKSQHVTEMIYKEASRKSKLYLQLLPILCSASYLLHNLFRKAFLNTSLQVKSWNRHLVIEQSKRFHIAETSTPNTGCNTLPQCTPVQSQLHSGLHSAAPGTAWRGLFSARCGYLLSSVRNGNWVPFLISA